MTGTHEPTDPGSVREPDPPRRPRRVVWILIAVLGIAGAAGWVLRNRSGGPPAVDRPLLALERRVDELEIRLRERSGDQDARSDYVTALNELGIYYYNEKLFESARETFRRAVAVDGEYPAAHYNLGLAFRDTGEIESAVGEFRRTLELDPAHLKATLELGEFHFINGHYPEAQKIYARGLEHHPDLPILLNALGRVFSGKLYWEVAESYYKKALEVDPTNPFIMANLGDISFKLAKHEQARTWFEKAVESGFEPPDVIMKLGAVYSSLRQFDKAAEFLGRARGMVDNPPPILAVLEASSLIDQQRYKEARTHLEDPIVAQDPELRLLVLAFRGTVALNLGEFEEAREQFETIQADPSAAVWLMTKAQVGLGEIHARTGRHEEAIQIFQRAVAGTYTKGLYGNLGMAYLASGDHASAVNHFEFALKFDDELSPEHEAGYREALEKAKGIPARTGSLRYSYAFRDVTDRSGIRFTHFAGYPVLHIHQTIGPGIAVIDYDGDGFEDVFCPNMHDFRHDPARVPLPPEVSPTSRLFRNMGDGTFRDVTRESGLEEHLLANHGAFPDLDDDGLPDLVISGIGLLKVYRNMGDGTFREAPDRASIDVPDGLFLSSTSFGDLDRDGDLDGFVSSFNRIESDLYAVRPPILELSGTRYPSPATNAPPHIRGQPNYLLENRGAVLVDATTKSIVPGNRREGLSYCSVIADLDNSGWPDIFLTNDGLANLLLVNRGDGTFEDGAAHAWVDDARANMGIAVGDHQNDGDLDLVVTHWCREMSAFLQNNLPRPIFTDVAMAVGLHKEDTEEVGWGIHLVDLDHDSHLDLFVVNGHTNAEFYDPETCYTTDRNIPIAQEPLVLQGDGETFRPVTDAIGLGGSRWTGRSSATFDLDHDGDLDVVIGNNNGSTVLLENDGLHGTWTMIELVGAVSNRQAVGARVRVTAGGKSQMREVVLGSSYISQETLRVHFGLDRADTLDQVEIRWPSGRTQTLTGLPANRYHRIVESIVD